MSLGLLELSQRYGERIVGLSATLFMQLDSHSRAGDAVSQLMRQSTGDLMQQFLALLALEGRPHLSQLVAHSRDGLPEHTNFVMNTDGNARLEITFGDMVDLLL